MAEDMSESLNTPVELHDPPRRPDRRSICSENKYRVVFRHPAYESTRLFDVSAFDTDAGGIHHGTALLLCGVVAGGVWNGWLSEDVAGTRLMIDLEAVLTKPEYYFHLPYPPDEPSSTSLPYKWSVVLSLDDFTFPHERPPPGYSFTRPDTASSFCSNASVSSMSQAVKDRDVGCRVTGWRDGTERAYLCPRSVWPWFAREELEQYNIRTNLSGATSVDDMANAMTLTQTVHTALDRGTFVFVRKRGQWVPHFLDPTYDLGPEYHNTPIEMPTAVSEAFVFANIVVALLPRIHNFLIRGEKRKVIVKRETITPRIVEMTGAEIQVLLDQSKRPRSKSPRKRPRDPDTMKEPEDAVEEKRHCSSWSHVAQDETSTPVLTASQTSSGDDLSMPGEFRSSTSDAKIESLRWQGLKEQRSLHKEIACCDYDVAEDSVRRGADGSAEYGGGHVCMECLGREVVEESKD